jgi:hypothetical protein
MFGHVINRIRSLFSDIILVGQPNVGKSVLFSRITGVRTIASNYPGTTVDYAVGWMGIEGQQYNVIDASQRIIISLFIITKRFCMTINIYPRKKSGHESVILSAMFNACIIITIPCANCLKISVCIPYGRI